MATKVHADNSIFYAKDRKKILVLVPHEDDELFVSGNYLGIFASCSEIYIAFMTNGDYFFSGGIRFNESIRGLSKLIPSNDTNLIVLGYQDSGDKISNSLMPRELNDCNNSYETHGNKFQKDYSYIISCKHNKCSFENLVTDIEELILAITPDVIICNLCDKHYDHISLSLAFDKAFGRVQKREKDYNPVVLKKYAYDFSYIQPADYFSTINIQNTISPIELTSPKKQSHMYGNYEYDWDNRLRYPLAPGNQKRIITSTALYRALKQHRSQRNNDSILSIVNADDVFIHRRTDNLAILATIKVSSGNSSKINDFILYDWKYVLNSNEVADDSLWKPELKDKKRSITFEWKQQVRIDEIIIYGNVTNSSFDIICDDANSVYNDTTLCGRKIVLKFQNPIFTAKCEIVVKEYDEGFGISEIEIFNNCNINHLGFIKILVNDRFAYTYYYQDDDKLLITLYNTTNVADYKLEVLTDNAKICDGRLVVVNNNNKPIVLKASISDEIWDKIVLIRISKFRKVCNGIGRMIDKIVLCYDRMISCIYYRGVWFFTLIRRKIKSIGL